MIAAPITRDEGLLEVPGGRVFYRVLAAPGVWGTPLLVVHGGPGSPHDYLGSLATLAAERPVVFYDQLGCGRSERPAHAALWRLDRFVAELAAVRAGLGLDRVHLYGHSWGTMLVTEYVLGRPAGVAGLVLTSPCLSMRRVRQDMEAHKRELPPVVQKIIETHEAAGTTDSGEYRVASMAFYQRRVCRLDPWPPVLQETYAGWSMDVYRTMWGSSEFRITGNLAGYERAERLGEIATPTLLLCGQHDEMTPEATRWYQSLIPGAECVVFERSAHLAMLEEPSLHSEVVAGFLRRTEGGDPAWRST